MGVCVFNYVFYMLSSLPLLHTAMPTPCLNTFWHSDPYIFLHFLGYVFLSCIFIIRDEHEKMKKEVSGQKLSVKISTEQEHWLKPWLW